MSVIAELTLPAEEFELGRILTLETGTRLSLETIVPMGDSVIPFVWIYDGAEGFADTVRAHPFVDSFQEIEAKDSQSLYTLEWDATEDVFFGTIVDNEATVLRAVGGPDRWQFELRFPSHDALSSFNDDCDGASIPIAVDRVYNPTKPGAGPFFGLTPAQREALLLAVRSGYYNLPRDITTLDLGAELGISDQSVTERLRRGITNLVENTLLATPDLEETDD